MPAGSRRTCFARWSRLIWARDGAPYCSDARLRRSRRKRGQPPLRLPVEHDDHGDANEEAALDLRQAGDRARAQAAHVAPEGYHRELVERLDGLTRTRRIPYP
jgi:hypothetical protein